MRRDARRRYRTLGHKAREFKQHVAISLDALVPPYDFYRRFDRCIDLSFVSDLAAEFYSSFGRPSIGWVVFLRLQLIAFFEGIRSDRKFMEAVFSLLSISLLQLYIPHLF